MQRSSLSVSSRHKGYKMSSAVADRASVKAIHVTPAKKGNGKMPNYISRATAIIANIKDKDATVPPNAFLVKAVRAFARAYRSEWSQNLTTLGLVINPANTDDIFDIGTIDASDPPVFTPSTAGVVNRALGFHYIERQRAYNRAIIIADAADNDVVEAEDVGTSPAVAETRLKAVAETAVDTNMGTTATDPEV